MKKRDKTIPTTTANADDDNNKEEHQKQQEQQEQQQDITSVPRSYLLQIQREREALLSLTVNSINLLDDILDEAGRLEHFIRERKISIKKAFNQMINADPQANPAAADSAPPPPPPPAQQ